VAAGEGKISVTRLTQPGGASDATPAPPAAEADATTAALELARSLETSTPAPSPQFFEDLRTKYRSAERPRFDRLLERLHGAAGRPPRPNAAIRTAAMFEHFARLGRVLDALRLVDAGFFDLARQRLLESELRGFGPKSFLARELEMLAARPDARESFRGGGWVGDRLEERLNRELRRLGA